MSSKARKQIVTRLRQEGYEAARAGRTNPYHGEDARQWAQGFESYEEDDMRNDIASAVVPHRIGEPTKYFSLRGK